VNAVKTTVQVRCGDRIYRHGEPIGRVHCYAKDGVSVYLDRMMILVTGDGRFTIDHIHVSDAEFISGVYSFEPWPDDVEWKPGQMPSPASAWNEGSIRYQIG